MKAYPESIPLRADVWESGGVPVDSFVAPWAAHSPRFDDLVRWQGRVTDSFVDEVVGTLERYLG